MKEYAVKDVPSVMILHHLGHILRYQVMDQLEKYELKAGQTGVLFVLDNEGTLSQREIAGKMCVKPPSMTVMLQKMEKNGFVTRNPDKEDQRIIRITLTDKGKNCVGEIRAALARMEEKMFDGFSREEQILARRFLLQMQDNLMKQEAKVMTERSRQIHE